MFVPIEDARIFVIDDDPVQCEFARVHLQTPRAEFEKAADGAEGMLPIVVATGHDDVNSIDRAFEAAATPFVAMPVASRTSRAA